MKFSLQVISIILLVYFLIVVFLYFYQRNLLYHPNENNYSNDKLMVQVEKIKVRTNDNIDLLGWYYQKDIKKFKTILFFHGNAGSLENRIHKLNHFKDMNINFLIIAWRGFSGNKGKPSEKGLYEDGDSSIQWLLNKGIKETDIIIYGESLGTGVATHLSQNRNFAGLILETPFTSMVDDVLESELARRPNRKINPYNRISFACASVRSPASRMIFLKRHIIWHYPFVKTIWVFVRRLIDPKYGQPQQN